MLYDIWLKFQDNDADVIAEEKVSEDFVSTATLIINATDIEECPAVVTSTSNTGTINVSPGRKSMISIFQSVCFWPYDKPKVTGKKKRKCPRVPSVITSDQGKLFFEEKEKQKAKGGKKECKKVNYSQNEEDWSCDICKTGWFYKDISGISTKWIKCDECQKHLHFECLPHIYLRKFQLEEPDSSDEEYGFMCMDCSNFKNDSDEFD
ncbi:hypothetical protein AVEN_114267-1 [Araneus ventricosus]|uniref:PHD-type domain-containing protein n=1 Tax=Araneus ventricosus TaxID=182803 RepID=A0A4Y2MDK0_ARAVE|nr:hypothetical protein AVEN_114267-1 [Araneus ventricosus]